jgi:hypothetical protein
MLKILFTCIKEQSLTNSLNHDKIIVILSSRCYLLLHHYSCYFLSVSPCSSDPCQNGGSCYIDPSFEAGCTCRGEWTGCFCSSKFMMFKNLSINDPQWEQEDT